MERSHTHADCLTRGDAPTVNSVRMVSRVQDIISASTVDALHRRGSGKLKELEVGP